MPRARAHTGRRSSWLLAASVLAGSLAAPLPAVADAAPADTTPADTTPADTASADAVPADTAAPALLEDAPTTDPVGTLPYPLDCTGPAPDADPGTAEWRTRDTHNVYCGLQRHVDRAAHPATALPADGPPYDAYRQPERHDGQRFRYELTEISGLEAEIYRPCAEGTCSGLPEGLETVEPPYPAVIVVHGLTSRRQLNWWAVQPLAEAGYLVVSFKSEGLGPTVGEAEAVLDHLTDPDGPLADEVDADRIGIAGHSQGAGVALTLGQRDPRLSAIVAWDEYTGSPGSDPDTPTQFVIADHTTWPGHPQPRTSPPDPDGHPQARNHPAVRDAGVDTMLLALRAATHLDWVPSELSGSRYTEIVSVYYALAWFDRYLADEEVVAADAFARLTADVFDDSADRHNLSQGTFDPVQAATSGDPVYGGNVPYRVEDMDVADRLSFYYRSSCSLTHPTTGGAATSDDLRTDGCAPADEGSDAPGAPELSLRCQDCRLEVRAGETGRAHLTVENTGDEPTTLELTAAAPEGWTTVVTPSEVDLAPGHREDLVVEVEPPRSARGPAHIEVTATADQVAATETVTVEVARGRPSEPGPPAHQATAGTSGAAGTDGGAGTNGGAGQVAASMAGTAAAGGTDPRVPWLLAAALIVVLAVRAGSARRARESS